MIDAAILDNWNQISGDNKLSRALKKTNKDLNRTDCTILDYQKEYLDKALSFCKNFRVAVDGGAHYGIMTYNLFRKFQAVHSFEIYEPVRECLKENVKKFQMSNVIIHDVGLGEASRSINLDLSKGTFGTHVDPHKTTGDVPIKALDEFNLTDVDFIKLDCEGYEPFIIKGAENTIKKYSPVILMERKGHTERWGLDKYEPVNILKRWGYQEVVSYRKDCIMVRK
jgi:FkbM family methyltransferase